MDSAGKVQERFIGFFLMFLGEEMLSLVLNENMQGYKFCLGGEMLVRVQIWVFCIISGFATFLSKSTEGFFS